MEEQSVIEWVLNSSQPLELTDEEWIKYHKLQLPLAEGEDRKVMLFVTQLVQYLGFGYSPAWELGFNKERKENPFLDRILGWGRTNEPLILDAWKAQEPDLEYFEELPLVAEDGKKRVFPIYDSLQTNHNVWGTPDAVFVAKDRSEILVVEIKSPFPCFPYNFDDRSGACGWNVMKEGFQEYIIQRYKKPFLDMNRTSFVDCMFIADNFFKYLLQLSLYLMAFQKNTTAKVRGVLIYGFVDNVGKTVVLVKQLVYPWDKLGKAFAIPNAIEDFYEKHIFRKERAVARKERTNLWFPAYLSTRDNVYFKKRQKQLGREFFPGRWKNDEIIYIFSGYLKQSEKTPELWYKEPFTVFTEIVPKKEPKLLEEDTKEKQSNESEELTDQQKDSILSQHKLHQILEHKMVTILRKQEQDQSLLQKGL